MKNFKKYILPTKLSLALFVILCAGYGIYSFFTTYGFQNPIALRSPIYALKHEVTVSPLAHGKKQTMLLNIGEIANKIYTLESSNGKNDSCRNLGLWNGYGFRQNSFEWVCYGSHDEVRSLVITWLTNHIGKYGIEKSLCIYNQGRVTDSCTYAMNYKSL
jgi:hypothetical protein